MEHRKRKKRRRLWGRHLVGIGALLLIAMCGYELWIRMEDFWAWTSGVRHLSQTRGTPFWEDMAIIFEEPRMRRLGLNMLMLLIMAVFSLVCLIWRNRRGGAWVIALLDAAIAGAAAHMGLYDMTWTNWVDGAKMAPQVMIFVGCVLNLIPRRKRKKDGEETKPCVSAGRGGK